MPATERQVAANRANAQKSTGPSTGEGKAASRGNALRHGMAAETLVLAVAGEVQGAIDAEREAWVEEIAPRGRVAARLAERAFRAFVRLQRCDRSEDAALDDRARRAESDWEVRRAGEVREAIDELGSAPSIAVARLTSTAEGADWLRSAWEVLAFNLGGGTWGRDDYDRAVNLLGAEEVGHLDLLRWTDRVVELRELRGEIRKQGVDPDQPDTLDEYFLPEYVAEARAVREAARAARASLSAFIADRVARLTSLAAALRPDSAHSRSLAESRALFDDSPEGKLRRRYAAEAEREMHRNLKAAQTLAKSPASKPAPKLEPAPAPKAEPTSARNEANPPPTCVPSTTKTIPLADPDQLASVDTKPVIPPLTLLPLAV